MHKRNYVLILFSQLLLVIAFAQIPVLECFWLTVKFVIGLLGLIFLPGLNLTNFLLDEEDARFAFIPVFGLMLQLLNVYVLWVIHIFYASLNFALLMCILTIIEVVLVLILSYKRGLTFNISKTLLRPKTDIVLITVIALYLILAFYWQQYAPSPHSDGAAYMDMARNAVEKGDFYSNMLLPKNTWSYVEYSSGMHIHMFGYFAIALFFMLGNVSLFSAKIMLIFTGLLIILVLYELVKQLFNVNVARLAALITAISPELLTHVGLVGGPEIPSALFTLFAIYLLINAPTSKRKLSMAFTAGLSLFIAWYGWFLNFFIFVTFSPILFLYTALRYNEFKTSNFALFVFLMFSFIMEWRILRHFWYATGIIQIPSLIILAFLLVYLLKKWREPVLTTFIVAFLALYLIFYCTATSAYYIPQMQQFNIEIQPGMNLLTANVARDVNVLFRAISIQDVSKYWNMYWNGIYEYLGIVTVFLGFISLIRIDKFKETLLIISFPLLQAVWWGLFVIIDRFQPRFIVCSSLFYFILASSTIEAICSYVLIITSKNNKFQATLKCKIKKTYLHVNHKTITVALTLLLLLLSYFNFSYPLYDTHKKVMEGWNYPLIFGWEPSINWIAENTQQSDIIMARQGNYWAWFTDRKTVFFTPSVFGSANITQLIATIREFKVKYLIVDHRFYSEFPELRLLYTSPTPFYGSKIVFNSTNKSNYKTIIYNVTNISYGDLVRHEMIISNCDSNDYWSPFTLYGDGSITTDSLNKVEGNFSIRIAFTVKEQKDLIPSATVTFNPPGLWDLSNASYIHFWIKAPFNHSGTLVVKLATDSDNYIMIHSQNAQTQNWTQIIIPLTDILSLLGNPNLHSIDFMQIYIRGVEPNMTYTYWLDNITTYSETFVIEH
ncbi:MAG: glycosyltransferase family 39 protein [Nitrososphaeria archaeon]